MIIDLNKTDYQVVQAGSNSTLRGEGLFLKFAQPLFKDCESCNIEAEYKTSLLARHLNIPVPACRIVPVKVIRNGAATETLAAVRQWFEDAQSFLTFEEMLKNYPRLMQTLDFYKMILFDALIANTDRRPSNILIRSDGGIILVDHDCAFQFEKVPVNASGMEKVMEFLFMEHNFLSLSARGFAKAFGTMFGKVNPQTVAQMDPRLLLRLHLLKGALIQFLKKWKILE
jgi:hypothetical protein